MKDQKKLYSTHIFLFPFKWDYYTSSDTHNSASFLDRTNLKDIENLMKEDLLSTCWNKFDFKFKVDCKDNYNNYNEYAYFHDFVRSTMAIKKDGEAGSLQYSYNIDKDCKPTYKITIKEQNQRIFELELTQIILNFYDVGVGFISFHLENYKYDSPDDVLKINDYGRRLYPQFLGTDKDEFTSTPKQYDSLPVSIELIGIDPIQIEGAIKEEFSHYDTFAGIRGEAKYLPAYITRLLTNKFVTEKDQVGRHVNHVVLHSVIDDRMFVMSYLINNEKMTNLKKYDDAKKAYSYVSDDFWYKYIFVDNTSPSVSSINMKEAFLQKHTYERWVNKFDSKYNPESLLFGMSRYSFVMLADNSYFSTAILPNHFRYIYFQIIALAIVQRAAILRFSGEASNIVHHLKERNKRQSSKPISELYLEYIYFVNRIYHREISPQEQGIELYNMLQNIMDINANVKSLDQEIEELNNYAKMIENTKKSEEAERLTKIATLFLPPTLVAAIFGFSNISSDCISFSKSFLIWAVVSLLLICVITYGRKIINYVTKA